MRKSTRVLVAVAAAVVSGLITAVLGVAVGVLYIVVQIRHLTPPITGTDAAYGVGMLFYVGVGLLIGMLLGLFVYFKVEDFLRSKGVSTVWPGAVLQTAMPAMTEEMTNWKCGGSA